MQPVNDDMDALFRRAAEDYPLNTGKASFEALLQKMQQPGEAAAPPPHKEQRRNYSWLLLLLLIPFVCKYYPGREDEKGIQTTVQNSGRTAKATKESIDKENTATNNTTLPGNNSTNAGSPRDEQPSAQQAIADSQQSVSADKPTNSSSHKALTAPANHTATNPTSLSRRTSKKTILTTEENTAEKYSIGLSGTRKYKYGSGRNTRQKGVLENSTAAATKGSEIRDTFFRTERTVSGARKNAVSGKQDTSITTFATGDTIATAKNKTTPLTDSTASDSTVTAAKKEQKKKEKVKPFFYIGLMGGIDYSVVKSKQTAGTGSNVGLVAGYSFGRHWAVETGFVRDFKKYRSEGEYVDTNGLGLAGHTQLLNVNGTCSIFEIPVNVQFHFGNKAKSNWYVGTGISSYLVKKEKYDYAGKRYNMIYYSEKEYSNSTKNWFSVLQLSGGYQVQMGRLGSLRAEPYMKLPLSKIGIASLPLSSAGINIGYIKAL